MRRARFVVASFLVLTALANPMVVSAVVPIDSGTLTVFDVTQISSGSADDFDPHVDGNVTSYTSGTAGNFTIRYYNPTSATPDQVVPHPVGTSDFLSDVSGEKIVFSRSEASGRSPILVYDTVANTTTEVDPQAAPLRVSAGAGGNTLAFIDFTLDAAGELLAADLGDLSSATRLTNDMRADQAPQVSPLGDVIVWESCGANCDIHKSIRTGTVWGPATAVTDTPENESNPDTDGSVIAYDVTRSGERDIYWQPVGGGSEQQLELPGEQRNPSVRGGVIAFESKPDHLFGTAADLMIYHIATNRLFRITDTQGVDEVLNDVARLPDGTFRLVWASGPSGNHRVFTVSFELPGVDTFDFGGFQQPVDPYPAINSMKAGAAVAVKFSLGGFRGLDIFAAGYPKSVPAPCGPAPLEDAIEQTVSAGNSSLHYDAATDVYSYIWKTDKAWAGTCRQFVIQFSDGLPPNYAIFKFK